MTSLDLLLAILVLGFVVFQAVIRMVRRYYKLPTPAFFTQLIDNPIRRRLIQPPETVVERMGLKPGMTVVEIGPGKGSYTIAVARRVLPNGKVYAVDIQESVVERLKKRIEREGITNVYPKIDDVYALSFDDSSVDRVLAITVLPEIPDPIKALRELHRILKPDGLLCLSELFLDPDYPLRRTEKRRADKAEFEVKQEYGNFFVYYLIFQKRLT
ncbi:methyltransferase domain-containing protein [Candidatus Bathyarchaeota archaeon]|nr:MAG: methyltransferase domain-containing protein [Candidatus Bathyarchaeota archaeon]